MKKIFNAAGKAFAALCSLLLAVLIALVVYIMVCNMQGKTAELFGRTIMKVVTGSMEPSIHTGDYILINKTDTSELKVGDIICFYSEDKDIYGMPNTHRIIEILPDGGFVTKGDANTVEDSATVSPDKVIGIYGGKLRFLRWINSFASGRKLLMVLVIIPMLCIAAYEVYTIGKIKKQCDEERTALDEDEKEKRIREAIEREKEKLRAQNYSCGNNENAENTESEVTAEDESGKNNES